MSFFPTRAAFAQTLAALPGPHEAAIEAARERQSQLTKPAGSLGRLEDIAIFMAGWQNRTIPAIDKGRTAIFAGNHGFMVHGVSAFPVSVTQAMVANYGAGGAAINALAGFAGMDLTIVPLELDRPTADFTQGPAMSEEECLAALNAGAAAVTPDLDLLTVGEMGIGNTASASALCAHSLGGSAAHWVGPGSGLDPEGVARKAAVVGQALALHADAPHDAFETLRRLGARSGRHGRGHPRRACAAHSGRARWLHQLRGAGAAVRRQSGHRRPLPCRALLGRAGPCAHP
jgi:nicotinate-nucleotide--dimethylbenzimidazole phosphoribosyltransferase